MGLISKISPEGIDFTLGMIQSRLYDKLSWSALEYDCYPRIYKNTKDGRTRPEHFIDGIDYQEVLMDDNVNASSFFLVSNKSEQISSLKYSNEVYLVCQVHLPSLYPTVLHRADEEAHVEVLKILESDPFLIGVLKDSIIGIDSVYRELSFTRDIKDDMEPFHVFAIGFRLNYSLNKCC